MNACRMLPIVLAANVAMAATPATRPASTNVDRGLLVLDRIDKTLKGAGRNSAYYLEGRSSADPKFGRHPSFAWSVGVQLSALNAAAAVNPARFTPQVVRYVKAVDTYWFVHDGIGGFCASANPQSADRYYDDNAWLVLDFLDAYALTHDTSMLRRAKDTMRFVMSGEDDKLGGGLYWHEQKKTEKNTCINAPAAVGALRLYAATKDAKYLDTARRLYDWTKTNLQDPADGLYFDHVNLDGSLDKTKFTYNTGLMIEAACLFYDQSGDAAYLREAERVAKSAEAKWFAADGAVRDNGYFAHLLLEAMLGLGRRTNDPHWLDLGGRVCDFLWQHNRDPDGDWPEHWDAKPDKPLKQVKLLAQSAAARTFLVVGTAQRDAATRPAGAR